MRQNFLSNIAINLLNLSGENIDTSNKISKFFLKRKECFSHFRTKKIFPPTNTRRIEKNLRTDKNCARKIFKYFIVYEICSQNFDCGNRSPSHDFVSPRRLGKQHRGKSRKILSPRRRLNDFDGICEKSFRRKRSRMASWRQSDGHNKSAVDDDYVGDIFSQSSQKSRISADNFF